MKLLPMPVVQDPLYAAAYYTQPASALPNFALAFDDLPHFNTRTLVGIAVAISGNILISLALNLQKLAHRRVKLQKAEDLSNADQEGDPYSLSGSSSRGDDLFSDNRTAVHAELEPLTRTSSTQNYGTSANNSETSQTPKRKSSFVSRLIPFRASGNTPHLILPIEIMSEDAALHGLPTKDNRSQTTLNNDSDSIDDSEGAYLKSKLWYSVKRWIGFSLMNVGELGNFISYAFAPASVVAPLGTFALMANCFFAPLLLKEHFRMRDLFGVLVAIIGAVTVVLASNASDTRLDSDGLLRAISQTSFLIYSCIYVAGAVALATLSQGQMGKTWVFVDVGLCALFGGFTVLSTKALSTLLTFEWLNVFTKWITYPLIAVLILTGVGQIRYLNRALMRFDSKVVIPVQFVLFTLSAIIGSAILYGDFQRAEFHQIITFLYGCAATFAGVFIIAWSPSTDSEEEPSRNSGSPSATPAGGQPVSDTPHLGLGSTGNRQHATLVLPSGISTPRATPGLRHKRSAVGMMAISPAQRLLLVHSPPRENLSHPRDYPDAERSSPIPPSTGRRRARSWYGQQPPHPDQVDNLIRGNSISGRLREEVGEAGSLEDRAGDRGTT